MNKRQAVEQAIREVCKELLIFERGCEVIMSFGEIEAVAEIDSVFGDSFSIATSNAVYDKEAIRKVIGHPIHLEHVMRAIATAKVCMDCVDGGSKYCASGWHEDMNVSAGRMREKLLQLYDLSLPFTEQSDELINFLHPILCAKE